MESNKIFRKHSGIRISRAKMHLFRLKWGWEIGFRSNWGIGNNESINNNSVIFKFTWLYTRCLLLGHINSIHNIVYRNLIHATNTRALIPLINENIYMNEWTPSFFLFLMKTSERRVQVIGCFHSSKNFILYCYFMLRLRVVVCLSLFENCFSLVIAKMESTGETKDSIYAN